MSRKKKKVDEKKVLRNIIKARKRRDMIDQGAYDGRFRERRVPDKKKKAIRRKWRYDSNRDDSATSI